MTGVYSPGWRARVELGPGQEHVCDELRRSIRHPSRTWHDTRMRSLRRAPSTAHRVLHRLAALGVIALQTTLGAAGGTRFTFGVRPWHVGPVRRGMLRRFHVKLAPGQVAYAMTDEDGAAPALPAPLADPFSVGPLPRVVTTPQSSDQHVKPPRGWLPPAPGTFLDKMRANGIDAGFLAEQDAGTWRAKIG